MIDEEEEMDGVEIERIIMALMFGVGERRVKHYSSSHLILLVGEGDFSFSLSLALAFGSASNLYSSSLDSLDEIRKYENAMSNLEQLRRLGATLLHGVDAKQMMHHPILNSRRFDRIVFNFPHAGFYGKEDDPEMIKMHKDLMRGFFSNARCLLRDNGEIHVSHKTKAPYCYWELEELARENSLFLIESVPFNIKDYRRYKNKRGHGRDSDNSFHLGDCETFKFAALPPPRVTFDNHHYSSHLVSKKRPFVLTLEAESNSFSGDAFNPKKWREIPKTLSNFDFDSTQIKQTLTPNINFGSNQTNHIPTPKLNFDTSQTNDDLSRKFKTNFGSNQTNHIPTPKLNFDTSQIDDDFSRKFKTNFGSNQNNHVPTPKLNSNTSQIDDDFSRKFKSNLSSPQIILQNPLFKFVVKGLVRLSPRAAASYAGALTDEKHSIVASFRGPLHNCHPDVAELLAIKHALLMFERSKLCGHVSLVVESESSVAVLWIIMPTIMSDFRNPHLEVQQHVWEIKAAIGRIPNAGFRWSYLDHGVKTPRCYVDELAETALGMKSRLELWY